LFQYSGTCRFFYGYDDYADGYSPIIPSAPTLRLALDGIALKTIAVKSTASG